MKGWMTAALVMGVLTLAACGGNSNDSSDSSDSGDYLAQADSVCISGAEAQRDINLEGIDTTPEETLAKTEEQLPARQSTLADLQAIEAPADAGPEFDAYVASFDDYTSATESVLTALKSKDQSKIAAANQDFALASEKRLAAAKKAGLTVCAGILSDEAASAAEDVVREFETTNDPATSCDYESPDALVTEAFVEDGLGGTDKCEKKQTELEGDLATDVMVSDTIGTEGVVAQVSYQDKGGRYAGVPTTATLYFTDGGWRIYTVAGS